jgi:hypothetical protein
MQAAAAIFYHIKMAETGCGFVQNGSNHQQELRAMQSKKPEL